MANITQMLPTDMSAHGATGPADFSPLARALYPHRYAVAAAAAGASGVLVGYPFDLLKTRMQNLQAAAPGSRNLSAYAVAKGIYRAEGVPGLFRGMLPPLFVVGFLKSLAFQTYESLKMGMEEPYVRTFQPQPSDLAVFGARFEVPMPVIIAAGALSGAAIAALNSPLDTIKVNMQMARASVADSPSAGPAASATAAPAPAKPPRVSLFGTIRSIRERNGSYLALYRAAHIHIGRDFIGTGVYFATYELFRRMYLHSRLRLHQANTAAAEQGGPRGPVAPLTASELGAMAMVAGGLAGMASWTVMFPLDLVKSRLQSALLGAASGQNSPGARPGGNSFLACARATLAEGHGDYRVFYRGLGPTLFRAFPLHALNFIVYESVREWIEQRSGLTN
ncbi:hypothetical protein H696_05108 [Fonticula alba]|uniref:MC family mitochondrial carrier protein n=1 Tax=Fonticula alba TaxID=691883 RepID=A0A058Z1L8_FONAL|nr:hypothetical protein H696_05108 [Fonticula alba]KCV68179.1 hypothetical protein H696_05108 [Fonticula alba]|eukprot:XP_009497233.1 hypothetical protein H696_05108 [Fonticula alba]